MAPKKGRSVSVQRPGPDWSWVALEDINDESEITKEHLRKAVGLDSARPCRNKLAVGEVTVIDVDGMADNCEESGKDVIDDSIATKKKSGASSTSGEVWGPRCTTSWCQDNVLCLNHLGGKAWNAENAREQFLKSSGLGEPPLERKAQGAPVGLRNLGATCYANAFLQIWFYNLSLRAGVYACAAAEGQDEDSPIFQLALTFAALQTSESKFYDPSGLVNALRLDAGNQQDASEFSKLFITHLQSEFSKQSDSKVKTLISDQFEGDLEYVTSCQGCGIKSARTEKFLELGISLEDNCELSERLDHLLSAEELSGENAYHCSLCESLQKARRKINLTHLPPTLHFSLLRFVYDAKLGDRKKSKAKVNYPARIDMSYWLDVESKRKNPEPIWYELRGVVEHQGASAHRGHFVCNVYDRERLQWYLCDDETVEPISTLTNVSSSPHKSKPQSKNGVTDCRNNPIFQSSTNAYMLVYERKAGTDPSRSQKAAISSSERLVLSAPTGRLAQKIADMNSNYFAMCEKYQFDKLQFENEFDEIRHKKLEVMRVWNARSTNDGFFMHLPILQRWIEKGLSLLTDPAQPSPKKSSCTSTTSAMANANDETGRADPSKLAPDNLVKNVSSRRSPVSNNQADVFPISSGSAARANVITKNLTEPTVSQHSSPLPIEFDNQSIICEHGKLCPYQTRNVKVISSEGLNKLKSLGCTVDVELGVEDICAECVWEEVRRTKRRQDLSETKKSFNRAMKEIADDNDGFLLPLLWLQAWRKGKIDNSHHSGISSNWQDVIACPHGKAKAPRARPAKDCIVVPPEAFGCLASLMEISQIPHFNLASDSCLECLEEEKQRVKASSRQLKMAQEEKVQLKDMLHRTFLANKREIYAGVPAYLLSVNFVNSWLEWVNDPVEVPRPNFSNRELFCEHDKILVDPKWMPDHDAGLFVVVYETLWNKISQLYDISVEDIVLVSRFPSRDREIQPVMTTVPVCKDCWTRRRRTPMLKLNMVEVGSTADIHSHVESNESGSNDCGESGRAKRKNHYSDTNFHDAKRQRLTRTQKKRLLKVHIDRNDTVLALKMKVNEHWDVFPMFQHIYHGEHELKDNAHVLGDVGVLTDDTLHVICDKMSGDGFIDDIDQENVAGDVAESLAGFGGTALLGLPTIEAAGDTPNATADARAMSEDFTMNMVEEGPPQLSCKACTFLNPPTQQICAMCDTAFD